GVRRIVRRARASVGDSRRIFDDEFDRAHARCVTWHGHLARANHGQDARATYATANGWGDMKGAPFLPHWIGDVGLGTPAIRALRERYPAAEFIGVCKPYVADVVAGSPRFDRIIPLDRGGPWSGRWPGVAWQLRRERLDLAVLFPNTIRSGLTAWLAGAR